MSISIRTVEAPILRICDKLHVYTRAQPGAKFHNRKPAFAPKTVAPCHYCYDMTARRIFYILPFPQILSHQQP